MRNLVDVIEEIILILSETKTYKSAIKQLNEIAERIKYTAPEVQVNDGYWHTVYNILVRYMLPIENEYEKRVMLVFSGRKNNLDFSEIKNFEKIGGNKNGSKK